ncbi:2' O-ribose methyltransferase [Aspergillus tubingensis]|uniref:rRNA methyltransferase 2, mitochondrial n=1 Tax=Aspergillus tubingensis TaxID=5068 RepID=A0A9W6ALE7_ASPTU|nr:2' O-ribose methyltransferase [Aspergillus tubingensis]GLA83152.1 2' O-ribose methyltransferase [Aspergillus tubingensis]GLA94211.1 2' O-ribose methyltransferase [Aspergillus tubingensis]GLB13798.1 2' O-ribose methyltransferase [Aspergillus tubingensis]
MMNGSNTESRSLYHFRGSAPASFRTSLIFIPSKFANVATMLLVPSVKCSPATQGIGLLSSQILKRFSSSKRWQARQLKDRFTREAAVQGLKSRAAFKLLQIDEKYHIFESGQTVVDLGYAPGSWSQVAVARTQPHGRVLGVDIIPAQPPKGVSTIQGNFLDPNIQAYVREFVRDANRGRPYPPSTILDADYDDTQLKSGENASSDKQTDPKQWDCKYSVDVVLSDMMMNTSGISFKDHAGSMDLCHAALQFSQEVLRTGGHLVCKFYQGAEDKALEEQLRELFRKVHRLKPESSRNESKESFFIGLSRK